MKYLAAILILLSLFACSLKRNNPLDPNANPDIIIPGEVSGIIASAFGSGYDTRYVRLEWVSNNPYNTDGYYVYRSLGYYSSYAVVDTVMHAVGSPTQSYVHSSASDPSVSPGDYWYRVSAFKSYPSGNLEGRNSVPVFVRIRN
ncbi:MAG TPA: hypothetical protein PLO57_08465 [Candidatus Cloacimonadota bacterium]|nr:hypothetical protein [Candidatus Cloacimonadota bacterium]